MINLFKILFAKRNRKITLLVLDDKGPEEDNSFSLYPRSLGFVLTLLLVVTSTVVITLFMFTPMGMLLYRAEDEALRKNIIGITERIESLQDSLEQREDQYAEVINVLRESLDTTFVIDERFMSGVAALSNEVSFFDGELDDTGLLSQNDIIYSEVLKYAPDFPSVFPVSGTLTQSFDSESEHYGIDIATAEDAEFVAVAGGTVISSGWSMNVGYHLYVQHSNGMVSVYKHCSKIYKKEGNVVQKGDILGVVGNTGLLSNGPHLHFELWKEGIPQDPADYLIR